MSDESTRSAPENPPDQRRNRDAPGWWAALERADLPDDGAGGFPLRRSGTRTRQGAAATTALRDRPARWIRAVLLTTLMLAVAVAIGWLGIGGGSIRSVVVALILFGVPAAFAALAAWLVVRRN